MLGILGNSVGQESLEDPLKPFDFPLGGKLAVFDFCKTRFQLEDALQFQSAASCRVNDTESKET